jgi:hypothetical protein
MMKDLRELCPQCRLYEPFESCWESDILCPLAKPPRNLDLYQVVRQLIWLLAEVKGSE